MTYYSSTDLANAFRTVRRNTLQVAHDIPADKFDFRATPDIRSVAETLAHLAGYTGWVHKVHGVDKLTSLTPETLSKYFGEANTYMATLTSREAVLAALDRDGREFGDWLATLTDETLAERVAFPPGAQPSHKTRFELLLGVKEHEMHHRAQLMLIERLVGVVPHLTRARQPR